MIRANVWPRFGWTRENPKALSTYEPEPQGLAKTHSLRTENENGDRAKLPPFKVSVKPGLAQGYFIVRFPLLSDPIPVKPPSKYWSGLTSRSS